MKFVIVDMMTGRKISPSNIADRQEWVENKVHVLNDGSILLFDRDDHLMPTQRLENYRVAWLLELDEAKDSFEKCYEAKEKWDIAKRVSSIESEMEWMWSYIGGDE